MLHLTRHVGNFVSKAAPRALYTTRNVFCGPHKSSLLVKPSVRIRQLSPFASEGCSPQRWFQQKASPQSTSQATPKPPVSSTPSPPLGKDNDFLMAGNIPTRSEQRKSNWGVIKRLLVNVWPKNDWKTRWTVLFGFGLLVSSKVSLVSLFCGDHEYFIFIAQILTVQVPHIFKTIVDSLNVDIAASSTAWLLAGSLILGCTSFVYSDSCLFSLSCSPDGAARIGATISSELLNAVFANIGQRAIRKVARETFQHLLNLDLKFHLERQTGGLTRAIDRGTK